MKAVDLFCGAGGASIGLDRAGVNLVGAVDNDPIAIRTYNNNPVGIEPLQGDLTEIEFNDIANHYGFSTEEIDLVVGCPPCQNFSSLRDTQPWPEDEPKDRLLRAFYQRVREAEPEYVLFENVPGIMNTDGGVYLEWLRKQMRDIGYGMVIDTIDAASFGVPQHRARTVGIFEYGVRDREVSLPEPTHFESPQASGTAASSFKTVHDAISDLPSLEAGETNSEDPAHRARNHRESTLEIIRAVPNDGGSRTDIENEDLILDCHSELDNETSAGNVYGRLSWNKPAATLTTRCTTPSCGRFIHPTENRGISFREAARLMDFPDFELPESNNDAERVIGNAVPPGMIESLLRAVV